MRVLIAAVGKLKQGPERELLGRFVARADAAGRRLGLSLTVREHPESRAASATLRRQQEAAALLASLAPGAVLVALDEGGRNLDSRAFAAHLSRWRDRGDAEVAFAIGGADGHGPELLEKAALSLAFGAMTWPHQFVRIMLAEQVYRAVTILSGHPYHRG